MNKRILLSLDQLYRSQPGGIGTYVRGLLQGLQEVAGDRVEVLGLAPKNGVTPLDLGVPVITAPLPLRPLTALWRYVPLGVPDDVDVVHAPTFAGPYSGGKSSAVHSTVIHDVLWRDDPSTTSKRGARFHESRLRFILNNKELHLFVPSPPLIQRLVNDGVDESRITAIKLGVDDDGVEPTSKAAIRSLLESHGVKGPFTLYAGTREPRKNLERLIRAHEIAVRKEPGLGDLVLVGPEGWGSQYSGHAKVLGLVPREVLKGLLRDARVMAYVPLAEGWGLPPIEALAQGTQVVASKTTPSVATNSEVVLVDPLDIESIVEGLIDAMSKSSGATDRRRRQFSVAALTWSKMAQDHLRIWQ